MYKRVALPELKIASPCPARWDAMRGDERRRFCESCGKHVHNFAELRESEIVEILKGESVCAQLYRRADGTILTADCPIGARLARTRIGKTTLRSASSLVALFGAAAYALTGTRVAAIDRVTQSIFHRPATELRVYSGEVVAMPPTTVPATQPIRGEISVELGDVAPTTRPSP